MVYCQYSRPSNIRKTYLRAFQAGRDPPVSSRPVIVQPPAAEDDLFRVILDSLG